MTSFCRSTNILLLRSGRPEGTCQSGRRAAPGGSAKAGSAGRSAPKPAAAAGATPARAPSSRQAASVQAPLQAPAERSAWSGAPGRKIRARASYSAARATGIADGSSGSSRRRRRPGRRRAARGALDGIACARERADLDRRDAARPAGRGDRVAGQKARCRRPAPCGRARPRRRAEVDERHRRAGGLQVERGAIRAVVVGQHHRAAARAHGVAVEVAAHRARQHDAGPVVLGEHQRPLERAGRQHHLARAHFPEALAGQVRRGAPEVVGDALEQGQIVVVVVGECGRAGQHAVSGRLASSAATSASQAGARVILGSSSSAPPSAGCCSARITRAPLRPAACAAARPAGRRRRPARRSARGGARSGRGRARRRLAQARGTADRALVDARHQDGGHMKVL